MKKAYILALLFLFASLMIGCSNTNTESVQNKKSGQNEKSVQYEQGNTAKIENLDSPALVFFFTGVG